MKRLPVILAFLAWCAAALAQSITNIGTDFWVAFPRNNSLNPTLELYISSSVPTSGNVSSAHLGLNLNFTVIPGIVNQVSLPASITANGGVEDKGIHITSVDPIAVYGLNNQTASTDAYMALPVPALGTDYRVLTYRSAFNGSGSCYTVVATTDGTDLVIFNKHTGATTNLTLNTGQTYHVEAASMGEDVTGSRVESNHPVAVFGGVRIGQVPLGCTAADHMVEQIFPRYGWGKNYVTVPLAGRDGSGDIFRVLAAEDGTEVIINGSLVTTLNAGDNYETTLTGYNLISSEKAILVAQFAKGQNCSGGILGDPFTMQLFPREQYLTSYAIVNVAGVTPFDSHWVNLVAPDYALGTIYEDGILIPAGDFTQVGTSNYYGAQRTVSAGAHTYTGTFPFGVSVYGWRTVDSYGYPGGGSLSPVATVNSVNLIPPELTGTLNITSLCLMATVLDSDGNPVEGILVTFHVTGINPLTGTGYTNSAGQVEYCYTQTGTASGTDQVTAEAFGLFSGVSTVHWNYLCNDPADGGTIGSAQPVCVNDVPQPLVNLTLPTGQNGELEYLWQQSTDGPGTGFTDIPGSNAIDFQPGALTQTTWFRRLSRVTCSPGWGTAAISNVTEVTVLPLLPVSVSVVASEGTVCAGEAVTYTATPVNGGGTPVFLWKVNGTETGTGGPVLLHVPSPGDMVTCTLTSSETCPTGNPATSPPVSVTVLPSLPVGITVTASANPYCEGSSVTFSALATNGGATPSYQWQVNGVNAGSGQTSYTYQPSPGDQVTCTLISSEACATGNPAVSAPVVMTGIAPVSAGVTIMASPNPYCPGSPVTLTAVPVNGGASPGYQWTVNGNPAGPDAPVFIYNPDHGDAVRCTMTSNYFCVTGNPALSGEILLSGTLGTPVAFTACFDTMTTQAAQPIRLRGGYPPGGIFSGPGVNPVSGRFSASAAGPGAQTITYTFTNAAGCASSASRTITVLPTPSLNCGEPFTDLRDQRVYPTVRIGTRCWMAANLNYGTRVDGWQPQTGNCLPEKYCYQDLDARCIAYGGLYRWDEVMRYDPSEGGQGLCPAGWHVPSDAEWEALCDAYQGKSRAGKPLQDILTGSFMALPGGVSYYGGTWNYGGFATLFWTSDAYGPDRALAHGMNPYNFSVSLYPATRAGAFPVRCIYDQ